MNASRIAPLITAIVLAVAGCMVLARGGPAKQGERSASITQAGVERVQPEAGESTTPSPASESAAGDAVAEEADPARTDLARLLACLAGFQRRGVREQTMAAIAARLNEFESRLIAIVDAPESRISRSAIEVIDELRILFAAACVRNSVLRPGSASLRVAAIEAYERLRTWEDADLRLLIEDREPLVLEASLSLVATRQARPLADIIRLLGHADQRVRAAAAAAVPPLSGEELDSLCEFAKVATGNGACAVASALGASVSQPAAEASLMRLLRSQDWAVRESVLTSLSRKAAPLHDAEVVLATVSDARRTVRERLRALFVLEATRSGSRAAVATLVPTLHPVLQMGAARWLINDGDATAIPILINLLDTEEADGVDDEDRRCVRDEARRILVEVLHRDAGPDSGAWHRVKAEFGTIEARPLQTPPRFVW